VQIEIGLLNLEVEWESTGEHTSLESLAISRSLIHLLDNRFQAKWSLDQVLIPASISTQI
jgi:hypothetical protein